MFETHGFTESPTYCVLHVDVRLEFLLVCIAGVRVKLARDQEESKTGYTSRLVVHTAYHVLILNSYHLKAPLTSSQAF